MEKGHLSSVYREMGSTEKKTSRELGSKQNLFGMLGSRELRKTLRKLGRMVILFLSEHGAKTPEVGPLYSISDQWWIA